MTHGYSSDSSWLFQSIAISYARWGYAVFCADLLGHGRSDSLPGYLGDMEAADAASLAFFLSVRTSGAYAALPAFLFGESMGGAATLLMYLRSPPAVRWTGLVLSAPPLRQKLFIARATRVEAVAEGRAALTVGGPAHCTSSTLRSRWWLAPPAS